MMEWTKLITVILAPQAVGVIGSIFTRQGLSWYARLAKPDFTPPSWLFAPVWTALYLLMGVAAYLVWTTNPQIMWIFWLQLALNLLWTILFFRLRSPSVGFASIIMLWAAIIATMLVFFRVSTIAGVFFIPYVLWVSFAALLNYEIWRMNI